MMFKLLILNAASLVVGEVLLPADNRVSWQILPQFPDHMLILHYDKHSLYDLDVFFTKTKENEPKAKCLYNYNDDYMNMRRPPGYKFVNLVFLKKWGDFRRFLIKQGNIKHEDVVIFVTKRFTPKMNQQFYYSGIENAKATFIYATRYNAMYYSQFYNDDNGLIHQVPVDEDGIPNLSRYVNTFSNFKHYVFQVGFSNCEPFVYKIYEHGDYVVKGVEFVVLKIIAEMLNFQINLTDFSGYNFPRSDMIQAVYKGDIDLAIGCISNTISRNALVDFSSDIHMEIHTAFYSRSGYHSNSLFIIFKPFHLEVWIYLLVAITLMGLLIKKMSDFLLGFQEANLLDYIKVPFRYMVDQPVSLRSKETALRIITVSWLFVAMIITNSYKGKLASYLIAPVTNEPDRLASLVKDGFKFEIPSNDPTFINETLSNSIEAPYKEAHKRLHAGLSMCDAIKKALTKRAAVIDEITTLKYDFWNKCAKNLTEEEIDAARLTKHKILPNSHVWAIRKAAPFHKRFTVALQTLQSTGIITKWYRSFNLTRSIPLSNHYSGSQIMEPLDIKTLFAPFGILVVGGGLSFIVFIAEQIYYRYQYNGIFFIQ